ncbi:cytochrome c biogenesis CcdA family protein [Sphingosinicellaceae bacterium]|nr:cytochrome c biogenesis CcdA family protein [Sphingosinicellaceae bacterium]
MASGLNPLLSFAAGALTILSPCVLPLVPIVLGSAAQRSRLGPLALGVGLVTSFTLIGFAVATLGASTGLDSEVVRSIGAVVLLLVGIALLVPAAQAVVERALAPLANWATARQSGLERYGLAGQAAIGVLLGLVWSPCVGPTLGTATVLAAQGRDLGEVALVMLAFGLGIASVLMVLAFAARGLLSRWRRTLMQAGGSGKRVLGGVVVLVALLIITGTDRVFEGVVVANSPAWLTDLTTSI